MKLLNIFIIGLMLLVLSCSKNDKPQQASIQDDILKNKSSFFYIDAENYPKKNKKLPIGIFDSGTGGLTVLDAIVNFDQYNNSDHVYLQSGDNKRDFNQECFIYLGDKANMPYGEYSGNNKTDLLKEHVIKDVQFLLGDKYYREGNNLKYQEDKEPIKALVIACNTATAYGKNDIEDFVKNAGLDLKVIGVIGAGVRGALSYIQKDENTIIGIMATAGTVASNGYPNTINEEKQKLGYTGKIEVFQQAGIGLAAAVDGEQDYINPKLSAPRKNYRGPSFTNEKATIEKSLLDHYGFNWLSNNILYEGDKDNPTEIQLNSVENYIAYHVVSLMEKIIKSSTQNRLNAVILGCTHYTFFTDIFEEKYNRCYNYKEDGKFIYREHMAEHVELIDPAINTAKELYTHLSETDLFNDGDINKSEFYISVPNQSNERNVLDEDYNFTYEFKYGRDAGNIQEYVKRVPFSKSSLSPEVVERLAEKIPYTFELIKNFNEDNSKTEYLKEKEKI